MKTEPTTPEFESSAERLADSLLSEHARLGSGNDEELIGNILAATVSKTAIIPARPEFGMRNWMVMGVSVAALVAVLLLVLSNFNFQDHSRSSDTFQFVVKMTGPLPSDGIAETAPEAEPGHHITASPNYGLEISPDYRVSTEVAAVKIKDGNFLLVSQFDPSMSDLPSDQTQVTSVTISADKSIHKGSEMKYSGKVVVTHNQFTLTADQLNVMLDKKTGSLIARGHSELTLASGEIKEIDPDEEELVLNGAAYLIRSL